MTCCDCAFHFFDVTIGFLSSQGIHQLYAARLASAVFTNQQLDICCAESIEIHFQHWSRSAFFSVLKISWIKEVLSFTSFPPEWCVFWFWQQNVLSACSLPGELDPFTNWPRISIDLENEKWCTVTLLCVVYLAISRLKRNIANSDVSIDISALLVLFLFCLICIKCTYESQEPTSESF